MTWTNVYNTGAIIYQSTVILLGESEMSAGKQIGFECYRILLHFFSNSCCILYDAASHFAYLTFFVSTVISAVISNDAFHMIQMILVAQTSWLR